MYASRQDESVSAIEDMLIGETISKSNWVFSLLETLGS